jgi:hypothetical protein
MRQHAFKGNQTCKHKWLQVPSSARWFSQEQGQFGHTLVCFKSQGKLLVVQKRANVKHALVFRRFGANMNFKVKVRKASFTGTTVSNFKANIIGNQGREDFDNTFGTQTVATYK